MPFKIVRNDITKMQTEAIVNTANDHPTVGTGCDYAVYRAAGYEELLAWRREHVGYVPEGEVFLTPGFGLQARYIIHAVSPLYIDGAHGEEERLRACYRKSLALAAEKGIRSIAFPLISTGGFGYPKEEGMRIAVDEIHAFLLTADLQVFLVVFDEKAAGMGKNLYPDLEAYIDENYVEEKHREEYADFSIAGYPVSAQEDAYREEPRREEFRREEARREEFRREESRREEARRNKARGEKARREKARGEKPRGEEPFWKESYGQTAALPSAALPSAAKPSAALPPAAKPSAAHGSSVPAQEPVIDDAALEELERRLEERMAHLSDTFPQYLLYLIRQKGLENSDVYKRAIVDKKVFSKIKNNPDYHPQKRTALCLCIGALLSLDEAKDLLARAGYALSPCDKTDIIFAYFIEHGIYDMIELDIQLEEHGLPCLIS